jgi:hypothetical protein
VIHDALIHHFERTPQPTSSTEFSMNLRRRLRRSGPVHAGRGGAWRTWMLRLYWLAAAAAIARYWRTIDLTPLQIAVVLAVFAAVVLTLRRGARGGPLRRVLRDAIWH